MALDTKKWLVDELGFSETEATELLPKFTEERAKKIEGGYLRQSDYSKRMNEVGKTQKDLADANERLNAEMAEWATLTAGEKAAGTKQRADLEKAQQTVLKLEQTLTRVATEAGLDPAKLMEGTTVVPPKKEDQPPPIDTSKFVTAETAGYLGDMMLNWPVDFAQIAEEHRALTGKTLDGKAIIAEVKRRAGTRGNQKSLDPRQVWEDLHEVPTLREAQQKKTYDEAIAAAEARGREAALTESSIPGQPPPGKHAPVFGARGESKMQRPQPGTGLQSAVAALRTGKYRQGQKT